MEELILQQINTAHMKEIEDYRAELVATGDAMEGCGNLKECSALQWIQDCIRDADPQSCPSDHVLCSQFVCVRRSDDKIVGLIKVRHFLDEFLSKYVGHIGYSVRPSERKRGYGTWMLKALLPYCAEIGLEEVLVCCELGNEASQRTILAAGGVFEMQDYSPDEDIYLERYWIKT